MKLEDVKCIGILGAGLMGGGIAQCAILAGYRVIVRDLSDEICERAKDTIINGRFGIKGSVERGKHTQKKMDKAISLLNFTTKVEDLSKSWDKTPVRVKDVPGDTGFIGNRVMAAARREALKIVEEGIATAEDVNTAMMLGFRWGLLDLAIEWTRD